MIAPVLFNLSFRGTRNLWACKKERFLVPRNDKSLALTREEVWRSEQIPPRALIYQNTELIREKEML